MRVFLLHLLKELHLPKHVARRRIEEVRE